MDLTKFPISPARRSGNTIYVSGQLAFDEHGSLVGSDIAAQTRQAMSNLERVLASMEATLNDVVKVNVWLTTKIDFPEFNVTYATFFESGSFPARSTVVSELLVDGARIEIEAIATVG